MSQINVIHGHDGAADDQMALLLLLTMEHVNLIGVAIMPADSLPIPAVRMTNKLLTDFKSTAPTYLYNVQTPNSFPQSWRDETIDVCKLMDADYDKYDYPCWTIDEFIDRIGYVVPTNFEQDTTVWKSSTKGLVYIETGPLTILAECLRREPQIKNKIGQLIWCGGGFDTEPPGSTGSGTDARGKYDKGINADGSQSWNAFIDPAAVKLVFQEIDNIIIFPRELTDKIKLTKEFYDKLPKLSESLIKENSIGCGNIYRKVYSKYIDMDFYRLWDVLTASYLGCPALFKLETHNVEVETSGLLNNGQTRLTPEGSGGKKMQIAVDVDIDGFYKYVLNQLSQTV